jgi:C4-dicarboxylate transporter DctQ subunit
MPKKSSVLLFIQGFLKVLHLAEDWFVRIVISVMTIVTFLAAINRCTLSIPMPWSEELVRILMAWLAFVGAAITLKIGGHIGINVFTDLLPIKIRSQIMRLTYVLGLVFCCILFYGGGQNFMQQLGQRTQALQISIGWRYACVPIGAVLMAIEFIFLLVSSFKAVRNEEATS